MDEAVQFCKPSFSHTAKETGLGGRVSTETGSVRWMWAEGVSGGNGVGGDVWAQPWLLVQLMALTEAGLWPYRGERWREMEGEGGERGGRQGLSAHWGLLSSQQPPAYGQSIRTQKRKKIDFYWKNRLEKYPALCLGAGFSDSKCVTPPFD